MISNCDRVIYFSRNYCQWW